MKKPARRKIKALLLDAGGTLVFPNCQRIADEFAREGVSVDPAALIRAEVQARFDLDRPEIILAGNDSQRWNLFFQNLLALAGVNSQKASEAVFKRLKKYHDEHNLWDFLPKEIPGSLRFLESNLRLGVVSNANGTVRALLSRLGIADRFEVIVDSFEEKIEKPDPRIFQVALDRMGLLAAETAYVGDFYHVDVVGARKAGLEPFLLDPLGLYAGKRVTRVKSLREILEHCNKDLES